MNDSDYHVNDSLKGFFGYKNTFDKNSVWVEVPKQSKLAIPDQSWPYEMSQAVVLSKFLEGHICQEFVRRPKSSVLRGPSVSLAVI